jgi:hypothetical protein
MAEFGAENQRPRPSSALLLLMAAQDIVLHLLWLLMGLLHDASKATLTPKAQFSDGGWPMKASISHCVQSHSSSSQRVTASALVGL